MRKISGLILIAVLAGTVPALALFIPMFLFLIVLFLPIVNDVYFHNSVAHYLNDEERSSDTASVIERGLMKPMLVDQPRRRHTDPS